MLNASNFPLMHFIHILMYLIYPSRELKLSLTGTNAHSLMQQLFLKTMRARATADLCVLDGGGKAGINRAG